MLSYEEQLHLRQNLISIMKKHLPDSPSLPIEKNHKENRNISFCKDVYNLHRHVRYPQLAKTLETDTYKQEFEKFNKYQTKYY